MGRTFWTSTGLIGFLGGILLHPFIVDFIPQIYVDKGLLWTLCTFLVFIPFTLFFVFKKPLIRTIFLFFPFFIFGFIRADFNKHVPTGQDVDFYNGKRLMVEGIIVETDVRRDRAKYTVEVEQFLSPENDNIGSGADGDPRLRDKKKFDKKIRGTLLVTLPKYPQYHYGNFLKITGDLKDPGLIDDFSYHDYLSRFGIYSVMYRPRVELLATGRGSSFWKVLYSFKEAFLRRINRLFPEPQASFEAGLLLGERKGISPELMNQFNATGVSHIIAISGYNITIIVACLMWLFRKLPRRSAFYASLVGIVLFTLLVGASPSVVRASIMGILGLIALHHGRQSQVHLTVLFTAFLMILWNPKILWFDVGFQLSFLAVLGLLYVVPLFDALFQKIPDTLGIRTATSMTLSAQVMALPIIIYSFDRLSLIAPVTNLLVAFAVPLAMLFGFIALLFSFLFSGLALFFAYITWGFLSYIIAVVQLLSSVPYASIQITGVRVWMIVFYYGFLIYFLIWYKKRQSLSVPSLMPMRGVDSMIGGQNPSSVT